MTEWTREGKDVVLGPPVPASTYLGDDPSGGLDGGVDGGAPTPEEVARQVAVAQARIDAERAAASGQPSSPFMSAEQTEPRVVGAVRATHAVIERAGSVSSESSSKDPTKTPYRPADQPKKLAGREPKYRLGSTLKIPGGFSGRVVKLYRTYEEVCQDPDVITAGGPERVLRGLQGTGMPSTKEQPFYRCTSNRVDYDLVVGELDCHLIQQGPDSGG